MIRSGARRHRTDALVVLYRWRLREGMEEQFVQAWSEVTAYLLDEYGSLGSRLHRGDDGVWYAYAQWPNTETRRMAFADARDLPAREHMWAAIAESLPEILLEPVADYLLALADAGD